jgi:N-acyl-D-amino-acid deacylase
MILLALLATQISPFDEAMEAHLKDTGFAGGALAVARDGKLVHAKGYGWADAEAREAAAPDALFRIASVSKPITAVAILGLVQAGKLGLDDKAFARLPGDKPADPRLEEVTIRQLLLHTAGWDREKSGDPMFRSTEFSRLLGLEPPADAAAVIRAMRGRPLDFDPGARYAYSNFGYCVLGRVIEAVTGEGYEAYVKRAVLAPMGITRMRIGASRSRVPGEVRYRQRDAKPVRSVFDPATEVDFPYGGFHLEAMDAHGGWIASAVDLVRFAVSLDGVLDETRRRLMVAGPPDQEVYYGLGWMVRRVGPGRLNTWHGGSLPGTSTLLVRRHDGLVWAALFNERGSRDGRIDPALHRAADAVTEWPERDLFGGFYR